MNKRCSKIDCRHFLSKFDIDVLNLTNFANFSHLLPNLVILHKFWRNSQILTEIVNYYFSSLGSVKNNYLRDGNHLFFYSEFTKKWMNEFKKLSMKSYLIISQKSCHFFNLCIHIIFLKKLTHWLSYFSLYSNNLSKHHLVNYSVNNLFLK